MSKTVCGFCGVGCGLEYKDEKLFADKTYIVNNGLSCAKGISSLQIVKTDNRLLVPKYRKDINSKFEDISWEKAISNISSKVKEVNSSKVAFYLSGQLLTEDYYIANKLAKGFIKTNNVDTNSRTCMASAVVAHKKAFGVDYVPVKIQDLEKANLLILIGSNAAETHVVLFNKIKKLRKKGLKLIVIDPRETLTAKSADLHLQIDIASDIDFLNLVAKRLIEEKRVDTTFIDNHTNGYQVFQDSLEDLSSKELLENTGLEDNKFEDFMKLFLESENIISAWTMGLNQSVQGVDKNLALINLHLISGKINREGNGPFSLTGQPNAMGGREVGGLSTTLAVHLDFEEESIKKVENFWNTSGIQKNAGLTALEIVDEALKGNIDVLIISHTDPIYHLPNRAKVEEAFKKISLIVDINAYDNSETSDFAHIKLPATPWGEKSGTQTNMDRHITKQVKIFEAQGLSKPDWKIFQLLAHNLDFEKEFSYDNEDDIFEEYKEMTKLSKNGHLDMYKMKNENFTWGEKLFEKNEFLTENKKANIIFVENKNLSEQKSKDYPFILLTGRTRDQWHSGTKTAQLAKLKKYKDLEFIEINISDAKELNISEDEIVLVKTSRGKLRLPAKLSSFIKEKNLFIPISVRKINYLTSDLADPISKEPDYNHSAASISKIY